jgi:hypothetical protein
MKILHFSVVIPDDREVYLKDAALARSISEGQVIHKIVGTVLQDKMILSVLDDDVREIRSRPTLPDQAPSSRYVPLVTRCKILVEKIRTAGRLCRADLDHPLRWQAAITKLLADGVIVGHAEQYTRRVYYTLVEKIPEEMTLSWSRDVKVTA